MTRLDELRELANKGVRQPRHLKYDEHYTQCSCVKWFRLQYPELAHRIFAVPNGGKRTDFQTQWLKSEGMLPGVSDLILLVPRHDYGALLIEMKTPKGKQSDHQKEWQADVERHNEYRYVICRGIEDFMKEVKAYLE